AYVTADFQAQESPKSVEVVDRSAGRAGVLTVLALLSVPGLLIWNQFLQVPAGVRELRSVAGLVAILVLALLLFAKQYVLAGRLSESLAISESTVSELSKLREQ